MLLLRRARVPCALLPTAMSDPAVDPVEPAALCDITLDAARIVGVAPPGTSTAAPTATNEIITVDLDGALVFPAFIDAHTHLDKAYTWSRAPNRSGTFAEALDVLWRDKVNWTPADLRRRAGFALRSAWAHGTRVVRSHIDTGVPWAESIHATMAELREQWRGRVELQTVPLCGGDILASPEGPAVVDLALRHGASALGGFLRMSDELPRQIDRLLELAAERGAGIDLHVDENGNPEAECLRHVAEAVLRREFPHPVVCGHCCSLAMQPAARQRETIARVKEARLGVISLPMCNLYLQDRRDAGGFPRTPQWRGITLVHDLLDAGVPVACASDNVRDAFFAFGDFNMLEVYAQSVRIAHLDGRLAESVRTITTTAADLVGRPDHGRVEPGAPGHLVVFAARSFSELLSRPWAPRRIVHGGRIVEAAVPDYRELA